MKTKVMFCSVILLMFVFTGIALGHEDTINTFYGYNAGANTADNNDYDTFIGASAGYTNTTGAQNTFVGYASGYFNNTGSNNTFLGTSTGYANTSGSSNTFVGRVTGSANTTGNYNSFMGASAGSNNNTGNSNTFIGTEAGLSNTTGNNNTFMGYETGYLNNGGANTFLGYQAGVANTTASYNTFLGYSAGHGNTTGNNNTVLGTSAGYSNTIGSQNVFLGYHAGFNETGSNKLYIANSDTATPLIYGEFSDTSPILTVNGSMGIGTKTPARQMHLVGSNAVFRMDRSANAAAFILVRTDGAGTPMKTYVVGASAYGSNNGEFVINDLGTAVSGGGSNRMTIANDGSVNFPGAVTGASFTPTSSLALKTNVRTYENALDTVKQLRGVSFDWKESGKPAVGLIAEEVDKVIPAVVAHNGKAATGVNYDSLVGVLVEAVKEQQKNIQDQQRTISTLSDKVNELERALQTKGE